jgi:large subunit ribosomal protein L3
MNAILGKKIGMTTIFDEAGIPHAITAVDAGSCFVTQILKDEKTGNNCVQIGISRGKKIAKPQKVQLEKAGIKEPLNYFVEVKMSKDDIKLGEKLTLENFSDDNLIDLRSRSKGKGFAGTIKRHKFHRGPKTHGSHNIRQPGSIGSTDAARVFKGKKMAGHMGNAFVTMKNLKILKVDRENNLLFVEGSVPGANNAIVLIKKVAKEPKNEA